MFVRILRNRIVLRFIFICFVIFGGIPVSAQQSRYKFDPTINPLPSSLHHLMREPGNTAARSRVANDVDPRWETIFTIPGVATGPISVLMADGGDLYVGGTFSVAGGVVANSIVKWDGSHWTSLGTGLENGVNGSVQSIVATAGKVFVTGNFSRAGQTEANGIAYWDGDTWHALGTGQMNGLTFVGVDFEGNPDTSLGIGYSIVAKDSFIIVGGFFNHAGGIAAHGIAMWNHSTSTWSDVGSGIWNEEDMDPAFATALAIQGDDLLVGGHFSRAGDISTRRFAKWDFSNRQWHEVGGGVNDWIRRILPTENGDLYVVGFFDSVGAMDRPIAGLARWDGSEWYDLGFTDPLTHSGAPDIRGITTLGNSVFIGGWFEMAGGNSAKSIARWDGFGWSQPGGGLGYALTPNPATITSLAIVPEGFERWLYAAGAFNMAGDSFVVNIARLRLSADDAYWESLNDASGGMGFYDTSPLAIESRGDTLYAGGNFTVVGGTVASKIARWNGASWEPLGEGIDGIVFTLAHDGMDLFVGGYFGMAGNREAYHIARWDGSEWHPVGIGVGGTVGAHVAAIALEGNYVYVGGHFGIVGDAVNEELPANSVARWNRLTERWDSLGAGISFSWGYPGYISTIATHGPGLIVGGNFDQAGDDTALSIARWNGTSWSSLGSGGNNGVDGVVNSVAVHNGDVIVGGNFTTAGTVDAKSLARWDGAAWHELAGGVSDSYSFASVEKILPLKNTLVVAGKFSSAGATAADNIAVWDGKNWSPLGAGTNAPIIDMAPSTDGIFIGGAFTVSGGSPSVGVGRWRSSLTGIPHGASSIPGRFALHQNHPNPFNPATTIRYSLSTSAHTTLKLHNVLGQEVRLLWSGFQQTGEHSIVWDGRDNSGRPASSGVYFYRIESDGKSQTRRMILMR